MDAAASLLACVGIFEFATWSLLFNTILNGSAVGARLAHPAGPVRRRCVRLGGVPLRARLPPARHAGEGLDQASPRPVRRGGHRCVSHRATSRAARVRGGHRPTPQDAGGVQEAVHELAHDGDVRDPDEVLRTAFELTASSVAARELDDAESAVVDVHGDLAAARRELGMAKRRLDTLSRARDEAQAEVERLEALPDASSSGRLFRRA